MDKEAITNIIMRLDRLEKAVFGLDSKIGKKRERKGASREGLPSHILGLRDDGFFKEPKTASEVHGKLQSKYHCEPDRVAMALLRLHRRRRLRKSSRWSTGGDRFHMSGREWRTLSIGHLAPQGPCAGGGPEGTRFGYFEWRQKAVFRQTGRGRGE